MQRLQALASRPSRVVGSAVLYIATSLFVLGLTNDAVSTPLPDSGTHLFESDFLGASSEVYNTNGQRTLVEGWTGERIGDHGGTLPTSTVASSIITYDGGGGNFSDNLYLNHTLSGIPGDYILQVLFRRDGDPSSNRPDFEVAVGGISHYVDMGSSHITGPSEVTSAFSLTTGVWYIMEIIDRRALSPADDVQLVGRNFDAPARSVDWLFIDAAPEISNLYEMRIWADGDARPITPLVSIVPEPSTALLLSAGLMGLAARRKRAF